MSLQSKLQKNLARLAITISCLFLAYAAVAGGAMLLPKEPYRAEDSISKLKKIGVALQLYRAEYGFLPVAQRKTYSDAGLPPSIATLTLVQGKPWSLPLSTFQIGNPITPDISVHFRELYYAEEIAAKHKFPDIGYYLSHRGEELPVLQDMNYPDHELWSTNGVDFKTPVLRLDGTVELITVNAQNGGTFSLQDCILGK